MATFWRELKRRSVVRVAVAYVVVGWLVLQLSDVLIPLLILPDWTGRFIFLLLMIGFPVALILAWAYELTPDGLKRENPGTATEVSGDASTPSSATIASEETVNAKYQQSIAVLPFVNMSPDPDQEYFADGLSEEILNLLAKIPELKVIGRTSSFSYKGKNEDLRMIGQQLSVATILEGSVRKSGDKIRVTAQLIDASDGAHLWSETYDQTLRDIFEVQDEVAAAILDALEMHVGKMPSRGRPTDDTKAYSRYLEARIAANAFEFSKAEQILTNVVELDPEFAEAYELLAYCYWFLGGTALHSADGQKQVGRAASRALEFNRDLVFAQAMDKAANTSPYAFQVELDALERGIQREAKNPWLHDVLIFRLIEAGYIGSAVKVTERFVDFDPRSPLAHTRHFEALYAAGRDDDALAALETAASLGSDAAEWDLAHLMLSKGEDEAAIRHMVAFLTQNGYPDTSWVEGLVHGARDPETGQSHLDNRIPEIIAATPDAYAFELEGILLTWYMFFGFLDRQFERIAELHLTNTAWTDADMPLWLGVVYQRLGFTAHPKYLEIAGKVGLTKLWENRGAPDFAA